MKSAAAFYVFAKWKHATVHAFGSRHKPSLVPLEDKGAYGAIFDELVAAATSARETVPGGGVVDLKPMNFSPEYGSRGHRPVDLWVSLRGVKSAPFGEMPQVYAIASERGVEVGFAVSIDEADYHDPSVKARNRTIVPLLNAKLPGPSEPIVAALDQSLAEQGGWVFNTKTRLVAGDPGFDRYGSLAELLTALKGSGDATGGGTVCRLFSPSELGKVDLDSEFARALSAFLPLINRCAPDSWDAEVIDHQDIVQDLADEAEWAPFDPEAPAEGKRRVLAEVARRQGQAAFRKDLMKAYGGRCVITGASVPSVLQAAHITPYLGKQTNHVTNGLLLRADVHTLFDLRLLKIDPVSMEVRLSDGLKGTPYAKYEGRILAAPAKASQCPSPKALQKQFLGTAITEVDPASDSTG